MKLSHLAHVVFKNFMSKVVPSLLCLALALFELIIWNDLFKLLQRYHSNTFDPKKLMDQRWFDMVNLMDLHCHSDNKSQCYIGIFNVRIRLKYKNRRSLLVKLRHCCE
jgi:hypothetical protein